MDNGSNDHNNPLDPSILTWRLLENCAFFISLKMCNIAFFYKLSPLMQWLSLTLGAVKNETLRFL